MATNKKRITEGAVKKMISETAMYIKAKNEIWEKTLKLESELKSLNESHNEMKGSYGFKSPEDTSNKTKTGFVDDNGPISSLSSLGAEIQAAHEEAIAKDEEESLMNENVLKQIKALRKEVKELKSKK